MSIDISVIIPAYNEEDRLGSTLDRTLSYFKKLGRPFEVIVVDDGSSDGTAQLVKEFSSKHPEISLISYAFNEGKGYAVKFGILNAIGRRCLVMDSDCSTPVEEFTKLDTELDRGAKVAIGSRALFGPDAVVKTLWYRKLIGRIFNGLVNFILVPGIMDTQCGFKLFEATLAKEIFSRQTIKGFAFDCEILHYYQRAGEKISEVPVNWTNISGSKVNLVLHPVQMLLDIIRVRLSN